VPQEYLRFGENSDWTKFGEKTGGRNAAGEFGGIYQNREGKKALIKQDKKVFANISEFLGGAFFKSITPQNAPNISLMIPAGQKEKASDGSNVYVSSELLDNYTDMFVDIERNLHGNKEFNSKNRILFMGTREALTGKLTKAFEKLKYQNFNEIAALSLLMGDFDMHTGNIGVIRTGANLPKLVRIDFGNAFRKLTDKIRPHSFMQHLPLIGATNHFREFPNYLKNNEGFVDELLRVTNQPVSNIIDESFKELVKYYNKDAMGDWAKKTMPSIFKKGVQDMDIEYIKAAFKYKMAQRQKSLKEYAMQIKLGLLIEKDGKGYKIKDTKELEGLVRSNTDYFQDIVSEEKNLKFRDKKLGARAKSFIKDEIQKILVNDYKKDQQANAAVIGTHRVHESVAVIPESRIGAQDHVFTNRFAETKNAASTLTKIIRDEVIKKQQAILDKYPVDAGLYEINNLLPNKKLSFKFIQELENVQARGYKKFQEELKVRKAEQINWQDSDSKESKIFNIVDKNNNNIAPQLQMKLITEDIDISGQKIKNYRNVELPLKLAGDSVPEMHITLTLKDKNGNNAPADLGLFTAHYEHGKLVKVSSPIPIKFLKTKAGKEIGYIKYKGNIYTMPTSPALHRAMVKEVKKNQGMAINIAPEKTASFTQHIHRARNDTNGGRGL
jgi:LepB N-terminal domain/120 KDa Rickettsia surface antigen